jgi:hypothetical protein
MHIDEIQYIWQEEEIYLRLWEKNVAKNTQEQQKANQVIRIFQIACGLCHVRLTSLSICVCYC